MANAWFETVTEAQRRAQRRLPRSVYSSLIAGAQGGSTVTDNERAFTELGFAPHVIGVQAERDLTTTVLGQQISMPVLISRPGCRPSIPTARLRWPVQPRRAGSPWGCPASPPNRWRR